MELDNGGESDLWMFFSMPCGILGAFCSVLFFKFSLSMKDWFSHFFSHYWYELEHGEILTSDEESDEEFHHKKAGGVAIKEDLLVQALRKEAAKGERRIGEATNPALSNMGRF